MHTFAENKPVKRHNETQLNNADSKLVCIVCILIDELPKNINDINVSDRQTGIIKVKKISETWNLESQLNLKLVRK